MWRTESKWLRRWCEQVWAEHKYLVMLHSYREYRTIAEAFRMQMARAGDHPQWEAFAKGLLERLTSIYNTEIYEGNAKNALAHAFGHVKRRRTAEEAAEWNRLLHEDWRVAWVELFPLAMTYGDRYLQNSRLFAPTAPIGHVWIRFEKQDWLVMKNETESVRLSVHEVCSRLPVMTEADKADYRLIAKLGNLTKTLEIYEKFM